MVLWDVVQLTEEVVAEVVDAVPCLFAFADDRLFTTG